jgi:hypothetical protein
VARVAVARRLHDELTRTRRSRQRLDELRALAEDTKDWSPATGACAASVNAYVTWPVAEAAAAPQLR